MLLGHQTWQFNKPPVILSSGTTGGPFEAQGPLRNHFDILHDDDWLQETSFEKAQQKLMEEACQAAINKSGINKEQVNFFISGDLINQTTPTNFAAKTMQLPFLGLFGACSTSAEGLALSATIFEADNASYILTGSSSHHAAAERQYRFPNNYGSQKPPTAQWTVTGAGCVLLGSKGTGPKITSATIGKVVDMGVSDPFNMGGAMAPAAVDTIIAHLKERKIDADYYDLIITGDLGKIGRETSFDLLTKEYVNIRTEQYVDCGLLIYSDDQPVQAGASGSACSAIGMYGYFLDKMLQGEINKVLFVATGALHSPLSIQQGDSIPCIAHAVSIETGSEQV